ncbi:MAG: radical SAM protein [Gemmatimonadales bacterium]|nr:radical SAM protein [Gemmatimonadales bacterium]
MLLGFALTQHCNLRCPHCIRDDITTVKSLEASLVLRLVDEARGAFGRVTASFTGGEPLLHPEFGALVEGLAARGVPYRFVTNGWHLKRVLPLLTAHPPEGVRLSLSGASRETHDHDRGRDSYRRVLLGVAMLTLRRIPVAFSLVLDRRNVHELEAAVTLTEALGVPRLQYILPQPVPGSAQRDSDLPPETWRPLRQRIDALAADPARRAQVVVDYGAPFDGPESPCQTFAGERMYVDADGCLSLCCQLSEYGFTKDDVVADLRQVPLGAALAAYRERLAALRAAQAPTGDPADALDPFPCLRCARAQGKLAWLRQFPASPWAFAAEPPPAAAPA